MFTRRECLGAAAAAVVGGMAAKEASAKGVKWPIGCFNRAWAKLPMAAGFSDIKNAGYDLIGLLSNPPDNAIAMPDATAETMKAVRDQLKAVKLKSNMTALRWSEALSESEIETSIKKQIEHAAELKVKYVMTFGTDDPANHPRFMRLMKAAAPFAAERKLQLVVKPHGGISAAGVDLLRVIETVGEPNFKVWYDAGNIIYYTGKDPVEEYGPVAKHVTGFCAKDCLGVKGEVMTQFGTGKVDFKAMFKAMKDAGFHGPIMVEGIKVEANNADTARNAKQNLEFLRGILQSL